MVKEWTETIYIIIPIASRDDMGTIALNILSDVAEDLMFDSLRLSVTGDDPATHLMSICPLKKEYAEQFRLLALPTTSKPAEYPTKTVAAKDVTTFDDAKLDSKFITIITDRIDGEAVKPTLTVKLAESKHSHITTISNHQTIISEVGLIQIEIDDL